MSSMWIPDHSPRKFLIASLKRVRTGKFQLKKPRKDGTSGILTCVVSTHQAARILMMLSTASLCRMEITKLEFISPM